MLSVSAAPSAGFTSVFRSHAGCYFRPGNILVAETETCGYLWDQFSRFASSRATRPVLSWTEKAIDF